MNKAAIPERIKKLVTAFNRLSDSKRYHSVSIGYDDLNMQCIRVRRNEKDSEAYIYSWDEYLHFMGHETGIKAVSDKKLKASPEIQKILDTFVRKQ